ncbi:MAG: DUF2938 domain-containing protein [Chloroflexi bacterium]|nr:DUF2938 domain-containing protein [Chloroflexota bacterium]
MNDFTFLFVCAILIGVGATLTFDLWGLFLKHAFKITPSNICFVGRWLLSMPEGTFRHTHIAASPPKRAECTVGWLAHYTVGIMFASVCVLGMGKEWLQQPTLLPAMFFGVVTVLAPFFVMQPSFGLGCAAAKSPNPTQARLRSLMNHAAFGVGLYLFGLLLSRLI